MVTTAQQKKIMKIVGIIMIIGILITLVLPLGASFSF